MADVRHAFFLQHWINLLSPVHEQDVISTKGRIHHQLTDPVLVVGLQTQDVLLGTPDRIGEMRRNFVVASGLSAGGSSLFHRSVG